MNERAIPRCMSTQHPDNVNQPFFVQEEEISGEDEIQEAYYAFSHLGCDEQMWDHEGKEVDNFVVKKLLTRYDSFFEANPLGEELFLTLRVPNPEVEVTEAKTLVETLESIPRSFDTADGVYGRGVAPIFEAILPMAESAVSLERIYQYYRRFVVGKQDKEIMDGDKTVGEWIGRIQPEEINVIPLFEDMEHLLASADITKKYLRSKDLPVQRVFLARSDPALNYGLVSAVLINKIALQRLETLSQGSTTVISPIIGVGSVPFRGNFSPRTVERTVEEYPSVQTFTIQSSFKYDHPPEEVRTAIRNLRNRDRGSPQQVDEDACLEVIERYRAEYQRQVTKLASTVNQIARFVPRRRKRNLHIGLFGYSRNVAGTVLPRAIKFTASLYSVGLPPEVLGLNALGSKELEVVEDYYVNFEEDLTDALQFLNPDSPYIPDEVLGFLKDWSIDYEPNEEHIDATNSILDYIRRNETSELGEAVVRAANVRGFIG